MPAGVEYSQEVVEAICAAISRGDKLVEICARDGMPSKNSFYRWMEEHPGVSDLYARAREERAELFADEIVHIADTEEDPNKARVRIDARKWAAAKLNPKNYGDRLDLNANVNVNLSDSQVESRLAFLVGKAGTLALTRGEGETEAAP